MEQYKVEITKEALQDMEDIYNYIAVELLSPENAMVVGNYTKYSRLDYAFGEYWLQTLLLQRNYCNCME